MTLMKQFYRGRNVLVTGGAGFIGSHITHKLVQLGAHVTVMDNCATGFLKNNADIRDHITFLQQDVTNRQACLEATKNKNIIFHLAALVSVPESVDNPLACHEINVDGTFNLLESARINNVERFVFSSSAAVYGPGTDICTEQMPCKPTSPYGTTKLIGELLCKQYAHNYGLKTVCLRYFNVFGAHQNPAGAYAAVVATFRKLMALNKPLTIFGDGLQTRDFIPVDQVVTANFLLGMQSGPIMCGSTYNIATGSSMSLLELIDLLKKEFPTYTAEPIFAPARQGDIKHSKADTSKWKRILG